MKCPQCSNNQRRNRDGMRCSCDYLFVFDPQQGDKMRDFQMFKLIAKTSANNSRFFTLNLLYGTLLRQPKNAVGFIIASLIALMMMVAPVVMSLSSENSDDSRLTCFFLGAVILFLTAVVYYFYRFSEPLSLNEFKRYFERWQINSSLKSAQFIQQANLHNPPPTWSENDIYHYGVEKVIILDNDLSVDLWIKNNEHVNHKALILSSDAYPNYLLPQLRTILTHQPNIEIFSLHGLRTTLRREAMRFEAASGIQLENYKLIDLGFNKKQIQKAKRLNYAYRSLNYNIPLDILPYASGVNLLAWANQSFAQNQHHTSTENRENFEVELDFDDFDFG